MARSGQEQKYFYEDEVWRLKKGNLKLGMVVETSEYSSDDDSSDEDEEQIKPGHVRVAWYPLGEEEILPEKKLSLVDRSLMPGDVVRRHGDEKQIQRGFCRKVKMYASVEVVGTKQVVYGVPTEDLLPLDKYRPDILICKDGWVGIVRDVKSMITLKFADGSKVVTEDSYASDLEDVFARKENDSQFRRYDFYPGQILFGPVSYIESGDWLECSEDLKQVREKKPTKGYKMTVENIEVLFLTANWLCRANFGSVKPQESDSKQPPKQVFPPEIERVRMLNVFEPITVQMGDRNFYRIKESDALLTKSEWKKTQLEQLSKKSHITSKSKSDPAAKTDSNEEKGIDGDKKGTTETAEDNSSEYEDCEEDKDTDSNCSDRQLDSGSGGDCSKRSKGRKGVSTKILRSKKKLKMSRGQKDPASQFCLMAQAGMRVVTETLSTQSEVEVMWQDGRIESGLSSSELYPVQHIDDHEFFPGDFVIESKDGFHPHNYGVIQSVDYAGRCCLVKWYRTYTEGSRPEPIFIEASESSVYDLKEHPDFKFRPGAIVIRVAAGTGENCGLGAGQVLDINTDGQVQVWWADEKEDYNTKTTGLCYPQDIYKVGEYDSDDGELWADDEDQDDDNDDIHNHEEGGTSSDDSWDTEVEYEVGECENDDSDKEGIDVNDAEEAKRQQILLGFDKVQADLLQQPCSGQPGATCCVKNLLALHTQMTNLDALMGTQFFDDGLLNELVGRLREEEKISSVERAVQSHVSRLFSHGDGLTSPPPVTQDTRVSQSPGGPAPDQPNHSTPDKDSGVDSFTESPTFKPAALTLNLAKANEESNNSSLNNSKTNSSSKQPRNRCDELRSMLKSALELAHDVARHKYGDQTLKDFTKRFEMCENALDNVDSELEMLNFIPCDTPVLESKSILSPTGEAGDFSFSSMVPLTPGSFQTVDSVPDGHKFKLTIFQPRNMKPFVRSIKKEIELLRSSLPSGITMRGFEDRMDLFSAMIEGPKNTPYEDGLFFFDFQLGPEYPSVPPTCNYISYCSDKLNPNLYEDGKVCVSLLGTWNGKGTETWTPDSNLLQLLVSIQGLILVREPYYNEAGYDRQRGTREGAENSRNYNEMAVLKLVQSMTRLVRNPPILFAEQIKTYCDTHAPCMIERLERWIKVSLDYASAQNKSELDTRLQLPDFPLLPASKGFCLSLQKAITSYKEALGLN